MQGLSLVVASGGHSSSRCVGLSLSRPLLLRSTGSRRAGSVVVAHGLSCSATCGILPDQGSNPCPRHWQADSQPLRHQGSPVMTSRSCISRCSVTTLRKLRDRHCRVARRVTLSVRSETSIWLAQKVGLAEAVSRVRSHPLSSFPGT